MKIEGGFQKKQKYSIKHQDQNLNTSRNKKITSRRNKKITSRINKKITSRTNKKIISRINKKIPSHQSSELKIKPNLSQANRLSEDPRKSYLDYYQFYCYDNELCFLSITLCAPS